MNKYLAGPMLGLYLALQGCAPSGVPRPASEQVVVPPAEEIPQTGLTEQLATLPGSEMLSIEGRPAVIYPAGGLFAEAAVIPLPGGTEVLEPLVEVLKSFPQQRWRLVVAARTEYGADYDQRLAQQRLVLVERYLKKRGVDLEKIEFTLDQAGNVPLQVVAITDGLQTSSSEVEKE